VHDQIIEMRNKRFAHNDDHHSVSNAMEIGFEGNRFLVKFDLTLEYQIGGATEWQELVKFLDAMKAQGENRSRLGLADWSRARLSGWHGCLISSVGLSYGTARTCCTVNASCVLPSSQLIVSQLVEVGYDMMILPGRYFAPRKKAYLLSSSGSSNNTKPRPKILSASASISSWAFVSGCNWKRG
jgi:hypothetical protein